MPLAGTELLLGQILFASVLQELYPTGTTNTVPPQPPDPKAVQQLQALCNGVAKGLIPYLILNAQVAPGQVVVTNTGSGTTAVPGVLL